MPSFFKARVDVYDCVQSTQRSDNRFDRLVQTEIEEIDVAELINANSDEEASSENSEE